MRTNRYFYTAIITALLTVAAASAMYGQATSSPDPKVEKKRQEIRKMAKDTLAKLYKAQPLARTAVQRSAGYAVFSDTGIKILVSGTGKGQGIAVNSKTKQETFMKMLQLDAGLGMGIKKFKVVFVFDTVEALNKFVDSGWEFGGQSDAAAIAGDGKGGSVAGAVSLSKGVWMYQLTDKGLALEITMTGTKYYKDDDLNNK